MRLLLLTEVNYRKMSFLVGKVLWNFALALSEILFFFVGSSFKLFLELEPQLRDIIFKFYESKYASCLKLLEEIKDNLLLDMYIAPHVNKLYSQIRNRALIQYFR